MGCRSSRVAPCAGKRCSWEGKFKVYFERADGTVAATDRTDTIVWVACKHELWAAVDAFYRRPVPAIRIHQSNDDWGLNTVLRRRDLVTDDIVECGSRILYVMVYTGHGHRRWIGSRASTPRASGGWKFSA